MAGAYFLPLYRVSWSEISPSTSDNLRWQNWIDNRISEDQQRRRDNTEAVLEALQQKAIRRNGKRKRIDLLDKIPISSLRRV